MLVDDCEIGFVDLLKKLDQWRWDYVLRLKNRIHVCLPVNMEWCYFGSWVEKPSRNMWLGQGW
jgi:hypothetical protein